MSLESKPRDREVRQALRDGPEHLHAVAFRQVEPAGDQRRDDDRDEDRAHALVGLEHEDQHEGADAQGSGGPVRLALETAPCRSPRGRAAAPRFRSRSRTAWASWLIRTASAMPFM